MEPIYLPYYYENVPEKIFLILVGWYINGVIYLFFQVPPDWKYLYPIYPIMHNTLSEGACSGSNNTSNIDRKIVSNNFDKIYICGVFLPIEFNKFGNWIMKKTNNNPKDKYAITICKIISKLVSIVLYDNTISTMNKANSHNTINTMAKTITMICKKKNSLNKVVAWFRNKHGLEINMV